jgi:roadblock/LC7 domain-containing protein
MDVLEELFQMEGVTSVAKLDDMGRIVDWKAKGTVSPELKEETSNELSAVMSIFVGGARKRPRNWTPFHGIAYSGGDMTMIIKGENAVIVETDKVEMDKIFMMLGMKGYCKK